MKPRLAGIAGLILLLCTATAVAQDEKEAAPTEPAKVCVNSRLVDNFDAFSDEYIYVEERGNKKYLFSMQNRCPGLRNSFGIAIKDSTSRVCSNGFGEVVYKGMGNRLQSCRIGKIEIVESKEEAEKLAETK